MAIGRDTTHHLARPCRGRGPVTPGGKDVLFDPWLSNPKSPAQRRTRNESLDLLLVTHGHGDHMGEALSIAGRLRPAWPCIHEMSLWLRGGCPAASTRSPASTRAAPSRSRGSRCRWTGASTRPATGTRREETTLYLGEPAGFVVELENGFRIYHAGDTHVFGDMALIRQLFRPDLAFLPIGGHFTMDPAGAALAVGLLGVPHVLPIHWGTFPLLSGTPADLRRRSPPAASAPRCTTGRPATRSTDGSAAPTCGPSAGQAVRWASAGSSAR